ncbi:MAG: Lrp/AsnC family transcriptional regulator [Alphaproteobacteria bacterium]|nr:Lrp/AsnC family transcriptional regulator [Alphaproteobacteria bacterium]
MDIRDRDLIDTLHGGFPVVERPYAAVAATLGISEGELIERLSRLLDAGTLTRFGPLYDAAKLGGAFTLAAMSVPEDRFDAVAAIVNSFPEVAHNYRRDHDLNMWFVVASERDGGIAETLDRIGDRTGLAVLDLPKEHEYFLELRLPA